MRVLTITSEWPTLDHPYRAPFLVQEVDSLRRAGLEVDVFSFRGGRKPLNYLRAWSMLRKTRDLSRYDVVHAQWGQSGLIALPTRTPLVVTFRGSDLLGIVGPTGKYIPVSLVLRRISRYVASHAAEVIIVSRHLAQYLPFRSRVHVIPGLVDFDLFRPIPQSTARRQLGWPDRGCFVLFPASPSNPVKRYELAEQAVKRLQTTLEAKLIAISGLKHEEVPIYMNACDALLLTSKHEGSPTVVREALACNLSVVSVDVGDVRQWIEGVEGCVVCSSDSAEAIARGLELVLRDRRRVRGREIIRDLDERVITPKIIDVYRAALRRVPGRSVVPARSI